jgi:phosphogluconate dehydratase
VVRRALRLTVLSDTLATVSIHPVLAEVTDRITARSAEARSAYLARMRAATLEGPARGQLGCANFAHGAAACGDEEKLHLRGAERPNIAIVTSYNDLLSAHQPYGRYPTQLKRAVRDAGGVAQVAGGVPAMCDGITQGREGMELSLFSRDVIAMATAIALSHDLFDGALLLGICDKIVPGLLIGALSFGHLPVALIPAGPMPSGLPNREKSAVRRRHAAGEVGIEELRDAEAASYHAAGTCTFYGTANSNQLVVEAMGLHVPGAAFVNPGTPERDALTAAAARAVTARTALGADYTPLGEVVDEKAIVNGVVALLATGGSTNHTMHLPAIAAAAGITLTWDDFDDLSAIVPLLARIYPNGAADVNQFHAAGGTGYLVGELLDAGLLHADVRTVVGDGLAPYRNRPALDAGGELCWSAGAATSGDPDVLRPAGAPFAPDGGIRVLDGSLGRAVSKVSALKDDGRRITAPARVFDGQAPFLEAFERGELDGDLVAVIRFQGPRANGMPELHKLTPALGVLQHRGLRVALVTDGRMSGASGTIPSAIHCTPEAADGGPLSRVQDGDLIAIDTVAGTLDVVGVDLRTRPAAAPPAGMATAAGTGRELFAGLRGLVGSADQGASIFAAALPERVAA